MSVEMHRLSNGTTVLIDPLLHTKTAALSYTFRIGARFENPQENGLAHFFEHMAFKGTTSRDVHQLALESDGLGAQSNAFTSKEVTSYYMYGLADDVFKFNAIESDMARNLALRSAELERERGVILQEIKRANDDDDSVLVDVLFSTLYPDQAYGRTVLGPSLNIKNFDRKTFDDFRTKHYHAGNLVVTVAGNVDPAKILRSIENAVGDMPSGARSLYEPASISSGCEHIIRPLRNQASLFVTFEANKAGQPGNAAEGILDAVLSGGMSSRLFREIREKRSLVYSVGSSINRTFDSGFFYASAGTSPEKVPELLAVLSVELDKMRQTQISDEELARAKQKIMVARAMQHDSSPVGRMRMLAEEYNLSEKIEGFDSFEERVMGVTKDDVQEAAQRVFSQKPSVISVGPPKMNEQEIMAARLGIDL